MSAGMKSQQWILKKLMLRTCTRFGNCYERKWHLSVKKYIEDLLVKRVQLSDSSQLVKGKHELIGNSII
ncbi:hypothetical protein EB796_016381 [Bugula neritina]|uniref:Uncharacterized protein n=1 Tax=Bugula neritina TaxID=10212 RepID=A0A7J7JIH8_BUGNE|nr:hypothetical protein EB796_016381 [Bugula neritina]